MLKNIIISLLCQCGLFMCTCVSKNSIVSKDLIFCHLWYNLVRWSSHICKKSSFLSFYSFLVKFSKLHGLWQSKINSVTKSNGVKNTIKQLTYFLIGPIFKFLFYCHIILYWEKVTSYEKFSPNLILEVQIVWKMSVF